MGVCDKDFDIFRYIKVSLFEEPPKCRGERKEGVGVHNALDTQGVQGQIIGLSLKFRQYTGAATVSSIFLVSSDWKYAACNPNAKPPT